ncbi:universal stress protein [soil metagenome]
MNAKANPVVVGISDLQPAALRWALFEARQGSSGLRIVHAVGLPAQAVTFYSGSDMFEELRTAGIAVIEEVERFVDNENRLHEVNDVTYELSTSSPAETLERESESARLLVLGSDQVSWAGRLVGGAVADHLARHAHCPVVVVPGKAKPLAATGGVVVALDGQSTDAGLLKFAFEHAGSLGSVLHVLHAIPEGMTASDAELVRANISEVLAGWWELYPDVKIEPYFTIGNATEACERATQDAELVVVGRAPSRSVPAALLRPLAARILEHASCPVAVVPSDFHDA